MKSTIYFIINSLGGGGAERVCVTLANGIYKRGINVKIVIFNNNNNKYIKYLDKNVEVINLNAKSTLYGYLKLFKFVKSSRPLNILAFTESIAAICILCKSIYKLNTIIVARNINYLSLLRKNMSNIKAKILFNFSVKFYPKSNLIISQSAEMKEDLVNNWNIDNDKIVVINNPVSENIRNYSNINEILTEKTIDVLFVGRLEHQKGIPHLINSIKICKKKGYNLNVNIVGTGSLLHETNKLIKNAELQDNIKIIGHISNVEEYYSKAKLVVLSSIFEGFPNVLIEAITLGTPVVSFKCPSGPTEIIKNGENGFLAEYLNDNDLADKIIDALNNNWSVEQIKSTSIQYNEENIIDQYESELRKVLDL